MGRFAAAALALLLVLSVLGGTATTATAEDNPTIEKVEIVVSGDTVNYIAEFDQPVSYNVKIVADGRDINLKGSSIDKDLQARKTRSEAYEYRDTDVATLVIRDSNGNFLLGKDISEIFTAIHDVESASEISGHEVKYIQSEISDSPGTTTAPPETTTAPPEESPTLEKVEIEVSGDSVEYTAHFDEGDLPDVEIVPNGSDISLTGASIDTTLKATKSRSEAFEYRNTDIATLVIRDSNGEVYYSEDISEIFTAIHDVESESEIDGHEVKEVNEKIETPSDDGDDNDSWDLGDADNPNVPSGPWPIVWDDSYSGLSDVDDFLIDSVRGIVQFFVGIPVMIAQAMFMGAQTLADAFVSGVVGIVDLVASGPADALDNAFDSVADQLPSGFAMLFVALPLMLLTFAGYQLGVSRLG